MVSKVVPPVLAAVLVAVIGGVSLWAGQALLAPSLGSAAFMQVLSPRATGARPWSVGAGQVIGLACGLGAVHLVGVTEVAAFMAHQVLVPGRVAAAVLAMLVAAGVQQAAGARSAAGGATALVVALGMETPTLDGAIRLLVGIALVTGLGEAARRAALRWGPGE